MIRPPALPLIVVALIAGLGTITAISDTAFAAPSTSIASDGGSETNAQQLLQRMLAAEKTLVLSGTQVTTVSRPNGLTVTSEQHVLHDGARALRLDYTLPAKLAGEVVIDNGQVYWRYLPGNNTVEQGPSRLHRLLGNVPQVVAQVKRGELVTQWLGQEQVAGHLCGIVQVSPSGMTTAPQRRFWIDLTNGAQLKIEQYNASGRLASTSYYTDVTYNAPVAKDAFAMPQTPSTVKTMVPETGTSLNDIPQAQQQVGFSILQPSYLPSGFHVQSTGISYFQGRKMTVIHYVNGLNTLDLFETPTPAAARPNNNQVRRPQHNVFVKFEGGLRIVLVGNLIPREMTQILNSVH